MTLVLVANMGSTFTIMTSDERLAYRLSENEVKPIENEREIKIYKLTDSVLFCWGGDYKLSHEVKDKLSTVVTQKDTLEKCIQELKQIADNMECNRGFVVVLSGFYQDGSSGMVMLKSEGGYKDVQELKISQLEYRFTMLPPTKDYSEIQNYLMHIEDFTLDNIKKDINEIGYADWLEKSLRRVVNYLIYVHGVISFKEPELTTPEGSFYLLFKDTDGKLQTSSGKFDTTQIHEQLKTIETEN